MGGEGYAILTRSVSAAGGTGYRSRFGRERGEARYYGSMGEDATGLERSDLTLLNTIDGVG